jgi:hypothetical protein
MLSLLRDRQTYCPDLEEPRKLQSRRRLGSDASRLQVRERVFRSKWLLRGSTVAVTSPHVFLEDVHAVCILSPPPAEGNMSASLWPRLVLHCGRRHKFCAASRQGFPGTIAPAPAGEGGESQGSALHTLQKIGFVKEITSRLSVKFRALHGTRNFFTLSCSQDPYNVKYLVSDECNPHLSFYRSVVFQFTLWLPKILARELVFISHLPCSCWRRVHFVTATLVKEQKRWSSLYAISARLGRLHVTHRQQRVQVLWQPWAWKQLLCDKLQQVAKYWGIGTEYRS